MTYEDLLAEIKSFAPWRGPDLAHGVSGFIHAPFRCVHVSGNNSGETRVETLDCLCGAKLDYAAFPAPVDQPAPMLWSGLQAFKRHLEERKSR